MLNIGFRQIAVHCRGPIAFTVDQPQPPKLASQSSAAFASMVSNTGCNSPGELEMTLSTSEVAVCCSSASFRASL